MKRVKKIEDEDIKPVKDIAKESHHEVSKGLTLMLANDTKKDCTIVKHVEACNQKRH